MSRREGISGQTSAYILVSWSCFLFFSLRSPRRLSRSTPSAQLERSFVLLRTDFGYPYIGSETDTSRTWMGSRKFLVRYILSISPSVPSVPRPRWSEMLVVVLWRHIMEVDTYHFDDRSSQMG